MSRPPSGMKARVLTIASVFFFLLPLLPFAIVMQRRAFEEAAASDGVYRWPRSVWNRPLLLLGLWLLGATVVFAVIAAVGLLPE